MSSGKFIQIDEEGFIHFDETRLDDEASGRPLLENIFPLKHHPDSDLFQWATQLKGTEAFVECFDQPYVARNIHKSDEGYEIVLPYGLQIPFDLSSLRVDEWDRFHGITKNNVQFVFSRAAQAEFFNQLDEFDDDSVTVNGQRFAVGPLFQKTPMTLNEDHWSGIYKERAEKGEVPDWDMNGPNPILNDILPQLKIPKSRVLVLAGGRGHDAAYFAEQGHIVTSVDYSEEATTAAKKNYGHLKNLKFIRKNIFELGEEYRAQYDVVFDHTCFCAVDPELRKPLSKVWSYCLGETGHLLGIFFIFPHFENIPYGATEWELRQRLSQNFDNLYWTRWKKSQGMRQGKELVVYSRKKG